MTASIEIGPEGRPWVVLHGWVAKAAVALVAGVFAAVVGIAALAAVPCHAQSVPPCQAFFDEVRREHPERNYGPPCGTVQPMGPYMDPAVPFSSPSPLLLGTGTFRALGITTNAAPRPDTDRLAAISRIESIVARKKREIEELQAAEDQIKAEPENLP